MGTNCGKTVRLYASQTEAVWNTICRDGVAFCKEDYIIRKYGTAAPVFLTAYRWFVEKAQAVVPRPAGASFPYWVFADSMMMETGKSSYVLALDVPIEEALFFDMYDWNQILQFHLLSEDPKEARHFLEELNARGIRANDVMLTSFYPDLRQRILDSWKLLFRHHESVRMGNTEGIGKVQAALWQIRLDWVASVNGKPRK